MREIQVSAKQLIFFFMTSVIAAVGIFLLGVSVGRGVKGAQLPAGTDALAVPTPAFQPPPASGASKPNDNLSYPVRLQGPATGDAPPAPPANSTAPAGSSNHPASGPSTPVGTPTAGTTRASSPPPDPAKAAAPPSHEPSTKPAPPAATSEPVKPAAPAKSGSAEAAGQSGRSTAGGWILQFNAFQSKAYADAQAGELTAKGYQAFVTESGGLFFVRMGPYPQRADAQAMADRLKKDGYSPLVKR